MNKLSYRLRDCRRNARVSGEKLGKAIGVTKTTVSTWENEKTFPSRDNLTKLAQYFDVSVDFLIGLTDDPTPNRIKKINEEVLNDSRTSLINNIAMILDELSTENLEFVFKLVSSLK